MSAFRKPNSRSACNLDASCDFLTIFSVVGVPREAPAEIGVVCSVWSVQIVLVLEADDSTPRWLDPTSRSAELTLLSANGLGE
jgi:hypothetical protein